MNLLYVFDSYRTIVEDNQVLKKKVEVLEQVIKDLDEQLRKKPGLDIPALVEELFQDQPYEDGRIPNGAWLTPGEPDRKFADND